MGLAFCSSTPGVTSTRTTDAHEVGAVTGQGDGGEAAERHADDRGRVGRQGLDGDRDVDRVRLGPEGAVVAAVGVAVVRQVEGHQGPVERQRDRVPRVGVLRAAVQEDELRRAVAPHQGAQLPARLHLRPDPAHDRRPVVGEPELPGVVLEVGELVVGHPVGHGGTVRHPRRRFRGLPG